MERQSFRQWGQLMVGITLAAVAFAVLWSMAGGWNTPSTTTTAWCIAALVVSYAGFLRPCVVVDDRGVQIRNILRDTTVPWNEIDAARSSWSLIVDAAGTSYTSWAISGTASPGRDALRRRQESSAATTLGPHDVMVVDASAVEAGLRPPTWGASAAAIAAWIERGRDHRPTSLKPVSEEHPQLATTHTDMAWAPTLLLLLGALAVMAVTVL
ncbi:hypothetical protein KEM60_00852 [Austwickia sp. TVS 96-490-7B]|uniref:PH domain-containing protein n=1 Tax=Austwickia sp. TVS 96-490-7B TaxID=2830843 RepID=UPI001C582240|nr:PH domain-containing protein [Austwickia sp. TVS 96-490-7B]MBW3084663.1 hypothetical protein [Austwickia sp. TVS 96-490-7B]